MRVSWMRQLIWGAAMAALGFGAQSCGDEDSVGVSGPAINLGTLRVVNPEADCNSTHIEMLATGDSVYLTWAAVPYDLSRSDIRIARLNANGEVTRAPVLIGTTPSTNAHPMPLVLDAELGVLWHGRTAAGAADLRCVLLDRDGQVVDSATLAGVRGYSSGQCAVARGPAGWYFWSSDDAREDHYKIQAVRIGGPGLRLERVRVSHTESLVIRSALYHDGHVCLVAHGMQGVYVARVPFEYTDTVLSPRFERIISETFVDFCTAARVDSARMALAWWKNGTAYLVYVDLPHNQAGDRTALHHEAVYDLSRMAYVDGRSAVAWVDNANQIKTSIVTNDGSVRIGNYAVTTGTGLSNEPQVVSCAGRLVCCWRDMRFSTGGNVVVRSLCF